MGNILLGVGPTNLSPNILKAIDFPMNLCQSTPSRETVVHLEEKLNCFFGEGRHSFVILGSGSAGMEACLVNILVPGDTIIVGVAGVFGNRIVEMADRLGAHVLTVEAELGEAVAFEAIERLLQTNRVKMVCLVHLETSTGVLQPMEHCLQMIKKTDAFLMLDVVASFGGIPLDLDKWGVDIAYASTQKCLSCPPGLTLISINSRMLAYLERQHEWVRTWYFDFVSTYDHVTRGIYPYTTPTFLIHFLALALEDIIKNGIAAYINQQHKCGTVVEAFLKAEGFALLTKTEVVSPYVKVFYTKDGIDAVWLKSTLENDYGIQIATGIGALKTAVIRIGTMGTSANAESIQIFQQSLRCLLNAGL